MLRRVSVVAIIFVFLTSAAGQEIPRAEPADESQLSKILKSAGTLLVRETHELPDLPTSLGNDVECEVLVVRNLLDQTIGNSSTAVGLVLKAKEKYSTRSTYIDLEEIDALLASIDLIQNDGMELTGNPQAVPRGATGHSIEIHYRTKDGMVLGVYQSKGELQYAMKLSPTADYAFLKNTSIAVLKDNLLIAKQVSEQILKLTVDPSAG